MTQLGLVSGMPAPITPQGHGLGARPAPPTRVRRERASQTVLRATGVRLASRRGRHGRTNSGLQVLHVPSSRREDPCPLRTTEAPSAPLATLTGGTAAVPGAVIAAHPASTAPNRRPT
jgi:hypothetical protein